MNAIEIEEAVTALAASPCDLAEFPFAFLTAFGNKEVTIKKLQTTGKSSSNKSDVVGGVLQRLNIHIGVAESDGVEKTLKALRESPQTSKAKAKYILATDGEQIVAEELASGDVLSCKFSELGDNFGFFLALAGISAVREVKDNPIDIKATSRLNKLYVELLKHNPDWATSEGQVAFNQFLARLVFCFFAEDTGVLAGSDLFTSTISQMTEADGSNTREVLQELFTAMDSDPRNGGRQPPVKSWADKFPYVNGGLFSGPTDCPIFSRTARSYLLRAGELDWQAINPDIFGSMIQAVADDDERGSLGMHYTSVPNIEKVLNPLFLDNLNEQLQAAGDNARKLLNLRKRLANIRVFDPACGSGNFLVIAYIRMREIEAKLMHRRGEPINESIIQLTQFFGIEIKPFAVEIARLSLLIAEFQCNVRLIGQMQAQMLILPLHETGHIVAGNALRIDWTDVCPSSELQVNIQPPYGTQYLISETYVCSNPPYIGGKKLNADQKQDMSASGLGKLMQLDYVCCWLCAFSSYQNKVNATAAFVTTSSVCQGEQVSLLWPLIHSNNLEIVFTHLPFRWSNNAQNNAGVTCCVLGLGKQSNSSKLMYSENSVKTVKNINPYLIDGINVYVFSTSQPINGLPPMCMGSNPVDGKNLILSPNERMDFINNDKNASVFIRRYLGGNDILKNVYRYCLWIPEDQIEEAHNIYQIKNRIELCEKYRKNAGRDAKKVAKVPHRFCYRTHKEDRFIAFPKTSSSARDYVPAEIFEPGPIVNVDAFAIYGSHLHVISLLMSKMHNVWLATTSGRLGEGYRYSVKLSYNTFPVPTLTKKDINDLTRCAENILLTREAHFPISIADLYDSEKMPDDLRSAHRSNDETLERIYIGRCFKNDTERLEKLFSLYTNMIGAAA